MFDTLDILTEFAEATALVPGAELWNQVCEASLAKVRYGSRKRWERWMMRGKNQQNRVAYMKAYDQTPARKAGRAAFCRKRRAAFSKLDREKEAKYQRDRRAAIKSGTWKT